MSLIYTMKLLNVIYLLVIYLHRHAIHIFITDIICYLIIMWYYCYFKCHFLLNGIRLVYFIIRHLFIVFI